jgi:hypothetical protein
MLKTKGKCHPAATPLKRINNCFYTFPLILTQSQLFSKKV